MKNTAPILRASSILATSEVVSNGCSLLRNLVLARILSKEDFGIAATLGLVVGLFELAGKMSFGQQVIRASPAQVDRLQAAAQTCQVIAGIIGSVLMVALAQPMSGWFGLGDNLGAFLVLAVIPIVNGFSSLEMYRDVRELRFVPVVIADVVPQVIITLLAWPMALWLGNYWAILWLLVAKTGFTLLASHLLARRPYQLERGRKALFETFKFGWPLLMSGYLILAIFQGDRMLVAWGYSMAEVGAYSVAATLAITPGLVILRITSSLTMPALSQAQDNALKFRSSYRAACQLMGLFAALMNVVICFLGSDLVVLLFGEKYHDAASLVIWLTIAQSIRIMRGASISAALARGDSVNSLTANLWRLTGLVLALICVLLGLDLSSIAIAAIIGELISLAASVLRGRHKQGTSPSDCLRPFASMAAVTALGLVLSRLTTGAPPVMNLAMAIIGLALTGLLFMTLFSSTKEMILSALAVVYRKVFRRQR